MLIALYVVVTRVVIPEMGAIVTASIDPIMRIVITIAGIVLLFASVGVHIANNMGTTVVGGLIGAIGFLGRTIIGAIGWFFQNLGTLVVNVFTGSRNMFTRSGVNPIGATLLAIAVDALFILVII